MPLFFNSQSLPPAGNEYVAWVDIMGTQAAMSRSIDISANFIFKLHVAALQAPHANVEIYPVMDGFYASSQNQQDMLEFLRNIFQSVADEFNQERNPLHRFIIRGGLAFGPVIHGRAIGPQASTVLNANPGYGDSILLGMPMIQAHSSESIAPPFGVAVHESARAFSSAGAHPIHFMWWKWHNQTNNAIWQQLTVDLNAHFNWCSSQSMAINYNLDRIKTHSEMAKQYLV